MGGRWATSVVASVLATSASGFVSWPTTGSSSCGRTATSPPASPAGYSWHKHEYSSSSSGGLGCGAVAAAGWASSSLSAMHQSQSRLFPAAATSRKGRRRRASDMMSVKLDTADAEKEHTYEVVFVRHGQSTWNKANRFIGWTDAELTEEGEIEARVAGQVSERSSSAGRSLKF